MFRRRQRFKSIRKRARNLADALTNDLGLAGGEASPRQPDSWRACMRRGQRLAEAGRYEEAARQFRRACARRPNHIPTLQALGATLLRGNEPRKALRRFDDILKLDPANAGAAHGKGLALHALADRDAALSAFRHATLHDPRAWRSWQSIADVTADEAERRLATGRAADIFLDEASGAEADAALVSACASELIHDGRMAEAVRFVERNFERFKDRSTAHSKLASAHYHGGAFEAAFFHMERALQTLDPASIPDEPRPSAFDPNLAIDVLREIQVILEDAGAQPFLAAGTLLGFVRDGGPLPHDRDIDLGVIAGPDASPDLAAILRTHPATLLKRSARPGDRYFGLLHRGVGVDLFIYERAGDHIDCGFTRRPGDIHWRFTSFGLRDAEFEHLRCRIPSDPERYLEETYGPDWRRPDYGFASAVSSPALFEVSPYARAFYSAARARNHLNAGNREKAASLIAQSPVPIDYSVPEGPPCAESGLEGKPSTRKADPDM